METLIDRYYSAGHKYNAISFSITFFIQSITKCFTVGINCKLKEREFKGEISLTLAKRTEFLTKGITQIKVQDFSCQALL